MKSFEEFEDRVDDLLTQVVGPAAGMEMLVRAKGAGVSRKRKRFGEFNDHHDDAGRWTRANPQDFAEEQARDVAAHIVRQSQRDAEFVKTALARLAIP